MSTPVVTIFVRHAAGCKYAGDEQARRCRCRKHLRWTANGKQHRMKAGTRSWEEAEDAKRRLVDQLTGKSDAPVTLPSPKTIDDAVRLFIAEKKIQGLTPDLIRKYELWLGRLQAHCESRGVYTVQRVTRETVTEFCERWPEQYPSTYSRSKRRERYKSFFRFCFESQWIERVPVWPKIKIEEPPTLPLAHLCTMASESC